MVSFQENFPPLCDLSVTRNTAYFSDKEFDYIVLESGSMAIKLLILTLIKKEFLLQLRVCVVVKVLVFFEMFTVSKYSTVHFIIVFNPVLRPNIVYDFII